MRTGWQGKSFINYLRLREQGLAMPVKREQLLHYEQLLIDYS
jgi:hypothetical protein